MCSLIWFQFVYVHVRVSIILLTLMLFQTSMCLFVLLNTKEDIWKNVLIKQISFPIDFHRVTQRFLPRVLGKLNL